MTSAECLCNISLCSLPVYQLFLCIWSTPVGKKRPRCTKGRWFLFSITSVSNAVQTEVIRTFNNWALTCQPSDPDLGSVLLDSRLKSTGKQLQLEWTWFRLGQTYPVLLCCISPTLYWQSLVPNSWFAHHSWYRSIGRELEQVSLVRYNSFFLFASNVMKAL